MHDKGFLEAIARLKGIKIKKKKEYVPGNDPGYDTPHDEKAVGHTNPGGLMNHGGAGDDDEEMLDHKAANMMHTDDEMGEVESDHDALGDDSAERMADEKQSEDEGQTGIDETEDLQAAHDSSEESGDTHHMKKRKLSLFKRGNVMANLIRGKKP